MPANFSPANDVAPLRLPPDEFLISQIRVFRRFRRGKPTRVTSQIIQGERKTQVY